MIKKLIGLALLTVPVTVPVAVAVGLYGWLAGGMMGGFILVVCVIGFFGLWLLG